MTAKYEFNRNKLTVQDEIDDVSSANIMFSMDNVC